MRRGGKGEGVIASDDAEEELVFSAEMGSMRLFADGLKGGVAELSSFAASAVVSEF